MHSTRSMALRFALARQQAARFPRDRRRATALGPTAWLQKLPSGVLHSRTVHRCTTDVISNHLARKTTERGPGGEQANAPQEDRHHAALCAESAREPLPADGVGAGKSLFGTPGFWSRASWFGDRVLLAVSCNRSLRSWRSDMLVCDHTQNKAFVNALATAQMRQRAGSQDLVLTLLPSSTDSGIGPPLQIVLKACDS